MVRPGQTVGVKAITLEGREVSSNLQLFEAICERLQEAGINACGILAWHRLGYEQELVE